MDQDVSGAFSLAPQVPPPPLTLEEAPLNRFHKRLAVYSAGGPFLDGYILSIIGVALIQITPALHLSMSGQGLVGAATLVGMFVGGFVGGILTDRFGRQVLYTWDLVALILCSVAQFRVESAGALVLLRMLIGVAVGADYPIATSLLVEFTPRRHRGPLLVVLVAMWYVGAAAAYLVGEWMLKWGPDAWRWILASAALPALIIVFLRHGTPESPRWLIQKGRVAEAAAVLKKVYGEHAPALPLHEATAEASPGLMALFRSGYGGRLLYVTTFWTCSIVPVFGIYSFGPTILEALGLTGPWGNVGAALITSLFAVGTVVSLGVINRCGRRFLVIHSFFWSGLALLPLGFFPKSSPTVVMICFSAFAILIGGTQVLQWVYPNELFPTSIRGSAVGAAASLSRIGAAVGTYLVPFSIQTYGIGATMLMGAAVTLLGFGVSLWAAPETTHLGLDQSGSLG